MSTLKLSQQLYDQYVGDLLAHSETMSPVEVAGRVCGLAEFAWHAHAGYLRDPRLEALLETLSIDSDGPILRNGRADKSSKKILFIATTVHYVGGHSKMMWNWMDADPNNEYHVALTKQNLSAHERFENLKGKLYLSDLKNDDLQKASALKKYITEGGFDIIMLFQHPNDVVPTLALQQCEVPVIYYNHADHVFWLGGAVADVVVDFRETGVSNTQLYRELPSYRLPYIIDPNGQFVPSDDNDALRKELSIPYDKVLVSMASHYKYAPIGEVDFFDTLITFLRANPDIGAYMIGPTMDDVTIEFGKKDIPSNLHLLGNLKDPSKYLQAADVFLEPFPMSTGLGMCEAIKCGPIPHFSYHDNLTIYKEGVRSLFDMHHQPRPKNRQAYYDELLELLEKGALHQQKRASFDTFIEKSTVPGWNVHMDNLYETVVAGGKSTVSLSKKPVMRANEDDVRFSNFKNNMDPMEVIEKFVKFTKSPLTAEMQDIIKKEWKTLAWSRFSLKGRKMVMDYKVN